MSRTSRLRGAAILCAALLAATPAAAQEEGVTIDSDAPAAKEYALPHEAARREASGESAGETTQGSRDSALFGEGVTADDPPSSGDSAGSESSKPSSDSRGGGSRERDSDASGAAAEPSPTSPPVTESEAAISGGVGATTALVGGGVIALFAVALGGFGLRAVRHRSDV